MKDEKFSWIETHKKITEYLKTKENSQQDLIDLLESVEIGPFNDKISKESSDIKLDEIDPFTFFCYIYKYGSKRRLKNLQEIAKKLNIDEPNGDSGIPSSQPQKVWLFPYKYERNNNEISRLWNLFNKVLENQISDSDFEDVLQINGVGNTKLTEVLFYINPEKYLPINGPTKLYIKKVLGINPEFKSYTEYLDILDQIKKKNNIPFYKLSYEAREWIDKNKVNYWIFQGNPKAFDFETALRNEILTSWTVSAHKDKIKEGDKVIIWITGEKSGCYALAEVSSIPHKRETSTDDHLWKYEDKNKLQSEIKITHNLIDSPILKSKIDSIKKLRNLKIGNQGTNFIATEDEFETLLNIIHINNETENKVNMNFPLNTILYGPPGTGKTYNTILRAAQIIENRVIDSYDEALEIFKANLHNQIEFITFHQNYSYEDFIQGLRPDTENDKELTFERKDGVFKIIADKALKNIKESEKPQLSKRPFEDVFNQFINPLIEGEIEEIEVKMKKVSYFITAISNKSIDFRKASGGTAHTLSIGTLKKMYLAESVLEIQGLASYYAPLLTELLKLGKDSSGKKEKIKRENYVIIIDEINRANISRVFGELITLIEPDKRSHGAIPLETRLPSGESFIVPSNLYIIGTMNTADKSIALLDIALRRRFEFESMYPKYEITGQEIYDVEILKKINKEIIDSKGHDFQIGHAYFMGENSNLVQRMNKKVIPLLLEYYMNDDKEVKRILNSAGLTIEEKSWPLKIADKNE